MNNFNFVIKNLVFKKTQIFWQSCNFDQKQICSNDHLYKSTFDQNYNFAKFFFGGREY